MQTWMALGISIGIGLLIGLQREWRQHAYAGARTFPLIAILGSLSALLAKQFGGWVMAAALIGLTVMLAAGRYGAMIKSKKVGPGITTEIAALTTFAIGAAVMAGYTAPAIVLGGTVAVLLQWRRPLHQFVERVGREDLRIITQFVLVALVILPLLPNRTFGWYDVLNPSRIWLIVVLIMGISLAGYVAYRWLGARTGAVLGGLLGGIVSSTATTVSYARQTGKTSASADSTALVIVLAAAVVYGRVALEIGAIDVNLLQQAAGPLAISCLSLMIAGFLMYRRLGDDAGSEPDFNNPAQFSTALTFAALFAGLLLAVSAVRDHFGTEAIYYVSALAGLTDVDAMTLSLTELSRTGEIEASLAWRAILLATMANLAFKSIAVGLLAGRPLLMRILAPFGITFAIGLALMLFWPFSG